MTDFDWKRKKNKKKKMASRVSGRQKGMSCQASTLQRFMVRRSRSYKHPAYGTWLESIIKINGGK